MKGFTKQYECVRELTNAAMVGVAAGTGIICIVTGKPMEKFYGGLILAGVAANVYTRLKELQSDAPDEEHVDSQSEPEWEAAS